MDVTTQQATAQSIDWGSIINNTVNQIPAWILLSRNQPVPAPGSQGATVGVSPGGVSASASPLLILAIAAVVIAFVLRK